MQHYRNLFFGSFQQFEFTRIPYNYCSSAIIARWNDALKTNVLQRVILNLDGEPFFRRVHGRPFGNSPGFENTFQFQPEVEMQPGGMVLVHNEPIPHEISTLKLKSKNSRCSPMLALSFQIGNVWSNFFCRQNCLLVLAQVVLFKFFRVTILLFRFLSLDRRVAQQIFLVLHDFQARAAFLLYCQILLIYNYQKVLMFDTRYRLFVLCSLCLMLLPVACVKQARVAVVAFTAEDVARAAAKQSDPTVVRAGSPAYLMLIDGLIEAYPKNSELLIAACKAYASYASGFLEDKDPQKAASLYATAKSYGFRALSKKADFQQAASGGLEEFTALLNEYKKKDVPALFWTASSWASWISLNLDNLEALADLPMLEATMLRVLELDDAFYYGSPHLLMAVYLAARPEIIGGNIEKAKEHFDQALTKGQGKLLMAKVLFAKYYARGVRDRDLFTETLEEVLATPADTEAELTLSNVLAQEKARELLEKADEYFGEDL